MSHKECCGPNTDHPPTWDWQTATDYLNKTGTIGQAQRTWAYWDPRTDTSDTWNGSGDFYDWLNMLPGEATDKWRNYAMSCGHMVAWNCGGWGQYAESMDVRGHTVTIPGGKTTVWGDDNQVIEIGEWPQASNWVEYVGPGHEGWYKAP